MKSQFLLLLPLLAACKKEPKQPDFPPTNYAYVSSPIPSITLESYSPEIVRANRDSLQFCLLFWDGDGDTATPVAGETVVQIIDNRAPEQLVQDFFPTQPLPPNTNPPTLGGLSVTLPYAVSLDPNKAEERTSFSLKLRDKAGNWSNEVRSGTIVVKRGN